MSSATCSNVIMIPKDVDNSYKYTVKWLSITVTVAYYKLV
jgi:hypothetical protein